MAKPVPVLGDHPVIQGLPQVRRALLRWHRAHGMHAPWRDSGDPYEVLVAAVMAQQTQMSRVMPSYERLLAAFPTVDALAAASPAEVIRAWRGMGYNQRAVRLHRAAGKIAADGWPRDAAALATIDGIGPFTAAIVASFAFGEPAACVDTNVRRVLGRLAGDETLSGRRLQALADEVLVRREPARWNQALMDYGAAVCTPRPKCDLCVVRPQCRWLATQASVNAQARRVAESRGAYTVARRQRVRRNPTPPFTESARYFRGRIIDVLRELPPGRTIAVGHLRQLIANGSGPPTGDDVNVWLDALANEGLVTVRGERVALPEARNRAR